MQNDLLSESAQALSHMISSASTVGPKVSSIAVPLTSAVVTAGAAASAIASRRNALQLQRSLMSEAVDLGARSGPFSSYGELAPHAAQAAEAMEMVEAAEGAVAAIETAGVVAEAAPLLAL